MPGGSPTSTRSTAYWREHYDELRAEDAAVQRLLLRLHAAAGSHRGGGREPDDPEVAHGPAPGRRPAVGWEGCSDNAGCCHGSCTHVWNYAQAIPHLFPALERTLRETEFGPSQDERGHQTFRSALPIRPGRRTTSTPPPTASLGGIMKVYREWRISGDTDWLRRLWPQGEAQPGLLHRDLGPGPQGRGSRSRTTTPTTSSSGARTACAPASTSAPCRRPSLMGKALGDDVPLYAELLDKGRRAHGERAVRRRVFHPEDRVEEPARQEPAGDQEHGRQLLAGSAWPCCEKEGPEVPVRQRLPVRRRARLVAGAGLRRGPGARRAEGRQPPAGRPQVQPEARPLRPSPTRSGRPTPAAPKAACCSAPGPRAASCRCRSSTRTKSGPASNTRWPRT